MANGGKRPNAGRKKGIPNFVKQITKDVKTELAEKFPNYNPIVAMAEIANNTTLPIDIRLNAHKEVSKYFAPQLKAIETKDVTPQEKVYRVIYDDGGNHTPETTSP